jgi:hypothetical protein
MTAFLNAAGEVQQVELNVSMYQQAARQGLTFQEFVNTQYPTNNAKYGTTFQQMLASEGIFMSTNRELGIRASTMDDVLNGRMNAATAGGVTVKDGVPASRILFPAVFLQAIEDKLVANLTMTADAFEQMIAVDESINGDRYEQPILNFSKPEAARSQGIAQLAAPASMLTITSSDVAYRIPTFSLGMEISDQALRASTLDIVALSLARQAAVQRNERAQGYMLALYNGDTDNNDSSLSTLGLVDASSSFDALAVSGNNFITQKAWMKYLMKNGTKRTLTHIVTDIDTAMKIETRSGKPNIQGDDPNSPRIDTQFRLMNPTWAVNPMIFLTQDASWPANTLMGIDRTAAIRRVRSLSADFQGIEAYVLRRSQAMRFDFGEHVNRLFTDAYGCMTLS